MIPSGTTIKVIHTLYFFYYYYYFSEPRFIHQIHTPNTSLELVIMTMSEVGKKDVT